MDKSCQQEDVSFANNVTASSEHLPDDDIHSTIQSTGRFAEALANMRLHVSEPERARLRQLISSTTNSRVLMRAEALLDLDAGKSATAVAQKYQVARSTVYNWVKRYRTRGLSDQALSDLPRPGRPRATRQLDV